MHLIPALLFLIGVAAYVAAIFLGATPAAARLSNVGGACVAGGLLATQVPTP